jgi:hypothetical protein
VTVAEEALARYEIVEDLPKGYREWCIRAAVLNASGTVELLDDEAEVLAIEDPFKLDRVHETTPRLARYPPLPPLPR